MTIKLYNTLSGKKEKFEPVNPPKVNFYLCGPTVYNYLHIGNYRGPIFFNTMVNWLRKSGYDVNYIYNYTDIDDKIIAKAQEENSTLKEITERYIKYFEEDYARLKLKPHSINPKVTETVPEIVELIQTLIDKDKAYVVDGEVFYRISSFEDYGKLSKNNLDDLQAGQRVEVDSKKENPLDFVLWKPAKEGEPKWESPWSAGRPGWHIECSAMIQKHVGDTLDIHGGGIDLTFPHHECEIAQGEGAFGRTYCRYWMHNEFINMNNEKMSKSLGNIITGRDFMDKYHAEILKFLFLSVHYRKIININEDKVLQAIQGLDRFYEALVTAKNVASNNDVEADPTHAQVVEWDKHTQKSIAQMTKSLNDDFNTSEVIATLFEVTRAFNQLKVTTVGKKAAAHKAIAKMYHAFMLEWGDMMGLFQEEGESFLKKLTDLGMAMKRIKESDVLDLIKKRDEARANKDWAQADQLRDELHALGVEVCDGAERGFRVIL